MEIRLVEPEEYKALGELTVEAYAAAHPPEELWKLDLYADELRDIADRMIEADVLVAVDDGTVLGGVSYVPDHQSRWAEFNETDAAGIRMLAVWSSAQGRGVGRDLTEACIERARAAGKRQILLHSTDWMTAAHRLYGRLGFDRDPSLDWEPIPDFWLRGFRLKLH